MMVARLDREANGGAVLAVNNDVGKGGDAYDLDAYGRKEATRNGDGLDSLVDGTRPHRLNFDDDPVFDHAGDGSRH